MYFPGLEKTVQYDWDMITSKLNSLQNILFTNDKKQVSVFKDTPIREKCNALHTIMWRRLKK